jgi:hypothetical protein
MADSVRVGSRGGVVRYVRDPFAQLIHVDGQWRITNPARNLDFEIELPSLPLYAAMLQAVEFCREPRTSEELSNHLRSSGLVDAEVLIGSLIETGLLQEEGSALPWSRWGNEKTAAAAAHRYFALRVGAEFVDYASPTVLDEDLARMHEYGQAVPPPEVHNRILGAPRLLLPHPSADQPLDPVGRVGQLLFWTFGVLREGLFLDLPMLFKAVPSMGARHALEAYVSFPEESWLAPGLYHYDVGAHALVSMGDVHEAAPTLVITSVFERFQWRYRSSVSYKDILFDLGHAHANLKLVAREQGISLEELEARPELPLVPSLFEDRLSAFRLGLLDAP